jgi:hypothetical protein
MRSKRFMTLRLPPKVEAARRLRCCDIIRFRLNCSRFDEKRTEVVADPPPSANGYFGSIRPTRAICGFRLPIADFGFAPCADFFRVSAFRVLISGPGWGERPREPSLISSWAGRSSTVQSSRFKVPPSALCSPIPPQWMFAVGRLLLDVPYLLGHQSPRRHAVFPGSIFLAEIVTDPC